MLVALLANLKVLLKTSNWNAWKEKWELDFTFIVSHCRIFYTWALLLVLNIEPLDGGVECQNELGYHLFLTIIWWRRQNSNKQIRFLDFEYV